MKHMVKKERGKIPLHIFFFPIFYSVNLTPAPKDRSGLERNVRGSILERSSVSSLWNIQLEAEVLSLRREATPTSLDCVMAEMVVMSKK